MRDALKNAIHNAILFECKLPHQESGLDKSCLSSQNDICFRILILKKFPRLSIMVLWNLQSTNMKLITLL